MSINEGYVPPYHILPSHIQPPLVCIVETHDVQVPHLLQFGPVKNIYNVHSSLESIVCHIVPEGIFHVSGIENDLLGDVPNIHEGPPKKISLDNCGQNIAPFLIEYWLVMKNKSSK